MWVIVQEQQPLLLLLLLKKAQTQPYVEPFAPAATGSDVNSTHMLGLKNGPGLKAGWSKGGVVVHGVEHVAVLASLQQDGQ